MESAMSESPVIVWFTHDLRLSDNAALVKAAETGRPILPVYILDDETPGSWAMGGASRWWLEQSLRSLGKAISDKGGRLCLRRGNSLDVLQDLARETAAHAIYFSRNHAPWSGKLEQDILALCKDIGIECKRFAGYLLHDPENIRTGAGDPYKVYTPFSKACFATEPFREPRAVPEDMQFWLGGIAKDDIADWKLYDAKPDWASQFGERWTPGEAGARDKLERFISEAVGDYKDDRDRPDLFATSRLSPHLHFGEISPLQCWHATRHAMADGRRNVDRGAEHFLKELLWREFSYHLLHHWPDLMSEPFRPEFSDFPWSEDDDALMAWQRGDTGYPIVDAGMRELWATGWMHNRVRMIAASFLVKDLLVPWQRGEAWFWDTLVDADIGSNSASWQWVAGCGADAAPYFRIFNPVLQGEKFDPDGAYVRRWVPELKRLPAAFIHKPWEAPALVLKDAGVLLGKTYPKPMVDHGKARDAALAAYGKIRKSA
jgi:deoxyribodipyrimidine photo-lyase